MSKRTVVRLVGTVALVAIIVAAGVTVYAAGPWEALCAVYQPSDPEYWVFYCYLVGR